MLSTQTHIVTVLSAIFALLSAVAFAQEVTLRTSDSPIEGTSWNQGWWSPTFANASTTNVSPLIGITNGDDHRAFFTFFLPSSLSNSQIISATLLQSRGASSSFNENGEMVGLFDVSTDPAVLNHNVGSSVAIYFDLGGGTSYGQFLVPGMGASETILELQLNAAALSDLTSKIGTYFSIGAALLSNDGQDFLLGSNIQRAAELRLVTVPEPTTASLFVLGFLSLAAQRRRSGTGRSLIRRSR